MSARGGSTLDWEDVWWEDEYVGLLLVGEACDFAIYALSDGTEWEILVVSDTDNKTAALSNVTFCFCEDATVAGPPEGPYLVERLSDYDEPTEPEEPDDD